MRTLKVTIRESGFLESVGRGFSGVSESHKQNCTAGNYQIEKASLKDGLPLLFYKEVLCGEAELIDLEESIRKIANPQNGFLGTLFP
jgi:hypothetical protein